MKTYPLFTRIIALLAISSMANSTVRADAGDGIAARAEVQAHASGSAPEVKTTPPAAAVSAQARRETAKPLPRLSTNLRREDGSQSTGIKTSPGTLIHPQVQDSGVPAATIKPMHVPVQEDYHMQQTL